MTQIHRAASLAAVSLAAACAPIAPPPQITRIDPVTASAASRSAANQVRRCYRAPRVPSEARRIATRLVVRYGAAGDLTAQPLVLSQSGVSPDNRPYAGAMAEAAVEAVRRCSPLSLPQEVSANGSTLFELTFSPALRA